MPKKTIDEILAESDELGLLANLKRVAAPASTEDHRVLQKFEEINVFIDRHGRQPGQQGAWSEGDAYREDASICAKGNRPERGSCPTFSFARPARLAHK
jgi:hypothetical protein